MITTIGLRARPHMIFFYCAFAGIMGTLAIVLVPTKAIVILLRRRSTMLFYCAARHVIVYLSAMVGHFKFV